MAAVAAEDGAIAAEDRAIAAEDLLKTLLKQNNYLLERHLEARDGSERSDASVVVDEAVVGLYLHGQVDEIMRKHHMKGFCLYTILFIAFVSMSFVHVDFVYGR